MPPRRSAGIGNQADLDSDFANRITSPSTSMGMNGADSDEEESDYTIPDQVGYKDRLLMLPQDMSEQPKLRKDLTAWAYHKLKTTDKGGFPKELVKLMTKLQLKDAKFPLRLRTIDSLQAPFPLDFSRPHYRNGILVAIFGTKAHLECGHCRDQNGPFANCLYLDYKDFGCANCEYAGKKRGTCELVMRKKDALGMTAGQKAVLRAAKKIRPETLKAVIGLLQAVQKGKEIDLTEVDSSDSA